MDEFDARCPRGSTRTDRDEDKAIYLKANPRLFLKAETLGGISGGVIITY
eukprot:SAG11_NODE_6244_length_1353_cov_114.917065_2_plen_50_part_00